ncbi:DUF3293 domain-containing protein [Halomonas denitrificans]|nr:DUF3293 domain-containing protein [Halomonas denitrificans]
MPPDPAPLPTTLVEAFKATTYRVRLAGGAEVDVRIGERVQWPADEPSRGPVGHWMIVTPDNPGARSRDEDENRRMRAELDAALAEARIPVRGTTRHIDPRGRWPDEHGRLVEVRRLDEGLALARRFGQAAVVCGTGDGPAELVPLPRAGGGG